MTATAGGRAAARIRMRVRVQGTVQGVGFRPFVYRLASELGLDGYVRNDSSGVELEVEGDAAHVDELVSRLRSEAPPLAELDTVSTELLDSTGARGFRIRESEHGAPARAPVAPDTATCPDCLRELFDRADRRFRYPFINCTNCGPRFTIVRGIPYDRPLTTMAGFQMCAECRAEYEDPADRRFHAQPNACHACGPQASLVERSGEVLAEREAALRGACEALRAGSIVAVKGLGGFHLACLAADEDAVAALRARKHREDKPFALMVRDLGAARQLIELTEREESLLLERARPIVVATRRPEVGIARAVAPASRELGVMLPYSPLHHLLLADIGEPLVMTSGNLSDEPIAFRDRDALSRLTAIADVFLLHDRPIETRTDDSVVRAAGRGAPVLIRRSRGYVPAGVRLPVTPPRPLLACGAELKNTFCVAKDERAWISHHIGDLENFETLESFREGVARFKALFDVVPEVVAHDLHPEYLSTKYALELDGVETLGVQHHHAHLAACLAEHGETRSAAGAIFDGTGYGTDETIWGGELLVGDLADFVRVGHLWPVRLPGGRQAVREPWRMAAAWLVAANGSRARPPAAIAGAIEGRAWVDVIELATTGLASPLTTSAGRLFDAIAAICGVRLRVNYEGQAAIELEAVADPDENGVYPMPLTREADRLVLDARETVLAVVRDVGAHVPAPIVSARFHNSLAAATAAALAAVAVQRDTDVVVLSGGSFQNRRLLHSVRAHLCGLGVRVLVPERLPPGDGGISYGQVAVAAAHARRAQDPHR